MKKITINKAITYHIIIEDDEKGMGPTFYGTLSYEGDLKVIERVKNILNIKKDGDS